MCVCMCVCVCVCVCACACVRADVSEVESFALYPGLVVVVRGHNVSGQILMAKQIYSVPTHTLTDWMDAFASWARAGTQSPL